MSDVVAKMCIHYKESFYSYFEPVFSYNMRENGKKLDTHNVQFRD